MLKLGGRCLPGLPPPPLASQVSCLYFGETSSTGESVTCTHIACTLIGFVWETESQAGLLFLEGETEVGGLCFCLAVVRLCLRLCKGFLWPWRGEVAMEQRRMRPPFAFPCAEISSLPSPIRSWQKSQRCGFSACHPPHTCCLWHLLL